MKITMPSWYSRIKNSNYICLCVCGLLYLFYLLNITLNKKTNSFIFIHFQYETSLLNYTNLQLFHGTSKKSTWWEIFNSFFFVKFKVTWSKTNNHWMRKNLNYLRKSLFKNMWTMSWSRPTWHCELFVFWSIHCELLDLWVFFCMGFFCHVVFSALTQSLVRWTILTTLHLSLIQQLID